MKPDELHQINNFKLNIDFLSNPDFSSNTTDEAKFLSQEILRAIEEVFDDLFSDNDVVVENLFFDIGEYNGIADFKDKFEKFLKENQDEFILTNSNGSVFFGRGEKRLYVLTFFLLNGFFPWFSDHNNKNKLLTSVLTEDKNAAFSLISILQGDLNACKRLFLQFNRKELRHFFLLIFGEKLFSFFEKSNLFSKDHGFEIQKIKVHFLYELINSYSPKKNNTDLVVNLAVKKTALFFHKTSNDLKKLLNFEKQHKHKDNLANNIIYFKRVFNESWFCVYFSDFFLGLETNAPSLVRDSFEYISIVKPQFIDAAIKRYENINLAIKRISQIFSTQEFHLLIELTIPLESPFILNFKESAFTSYTCNIKSDGSDFDVALKEFILIYLYIERGSYFNKQDFLYSVLRNISSKLNISLETFAGFLFEVIKDIKLTYYDYDLKKYISYIYEKEKIDNSIVDEKDKSYTMDLSAILENNNFNDFDKQIDLIYLLYRKEGKFFFKQAATNKNIRKIANYSSQKTIEQIIEFFIPLESKYIHTVLNYPVKKKIYKNKFTYEKAAEFILFYLINSGDSKFNKIAFTEVYVKHMAGHYNISYESLLLVLYEVFSSFLSSNNNISEVLNVLSVLRNKSLKPKYLIIEDFFDKYSVFKPERLNSFSKQDIFRVLKKRIGNEQALSLFCFLSIYNYSNLGNRPYKINQKFFLKIFYTSILRVIKYGETFRKELFLKDFFLSITKKYNLNYSEFVVYVYEKIYFYKDKSTEFYSFYTIIKSEAHKILAKENSLVFKRFALDENINIVNKLNMYFEYNLFGKSLLTDYQVVSSLNYLSQNSKESAKLFFDKLPYFLKKMRYSSITYEVIKSILVSYMNFLNPGKDLSLFFKTIESGDVLSANKKNYYLSVLQGLVSKKEINIDKAVLLSQVKDIRQKKFLESYFKKSQEINPEIKNRLELLFNEFISIISNSEFEQFQQEILNYSFLENTHILYFNLMKKYLSKKGRDYKNIENGIYSLKLYIAFTKDKKQNQAGFLYSDSVFIFDYLDGLTNKSIDIMPDIYLAVNNASFIQDLASSKRRKFYIKKIAYILDEVQLKSFIMKVNPVYSRYIWDTYVYFFKFTKFLNRNYKFNFKKEDIRAFILDYIVSGKGYIFSQKDFLSNIKRKFFKKLDKDYFTAFTFEENFKTSIVVNDINKLFQKNATKRLEKSIPDHNDDLIYDLQKGIHINNAGVILSAPFLPSLFNKLGIVCNGKFKTENMQVKGVFVLQYLACGFDYAQEEDLLLNKILCGMNTDFPVPFKYSLKEEEKSLIDGLINGMITLWEKIGVASVDGFRGNFFLRDGFLEKDDSGWILTIEEKGLDILVDYVPWSFKTVKNTWMDKPVFTHWR